MCVRHMGCDEENWTEIEGGVGGMSIIITGRVRDQGECIRSTGDAGFGIVGRIITKKCLGQ